MALYEGIFADQARLLKATDGRSIAGPVSLHLNFTIPDLNFEDYLRTFEPVLAYLLTRDTKGIQTILSAAQKGQRLEIVCGPALNTTASLVSAGAIIISSLAALHENRLSLDDFDYKLAGDVQKAEMFNPRFYIGTYLDELAKSGNSAMVNTFDGPISIKELLAKRLSVLSPHIERYCSANSLRITQDVANGICLPDIEIDRRDPQSLWLPVSTDRILAVTRKSSLDEIIESQPILGPARLFDLIATEPIIVDTGGHKIHPSSRNWSAIQFWYESPSTHPMIIEVELDDMNGYFELYQIFKGQPKSFFDVSFALFFNRPVSRMLTYNEDGNAHSFSNHSLESIPSDALKLMGDAGILSRSDDGTRITDFGREILEIVNKDL